jgi:hypothetical protein
MTIAAQAKVLFTGESIERLAGGRVKGSMLRAHVDWVRECGTREETIEFFESLSPEVRRDAMTVLASSWYSFASLMEIDRRILQIFGKGRVSFLEGLGRHSARRNLASVATMLHDTPPHAFFQRTAMLHRTFQDFGLAEYVPTSETSGSMVQSDYICFSPLYCASATGFYREAILMHGQMSALVVESSCQCFGDEACRFDLSWSR